MDYVRIVKEMREHDRSTGRPDEFLRPRYMVFENVGGLFSSNSGEDFKAVLTEIIRIAEPNAPDLPEIKRSGGELSDKWTKSGFIYDELGKWSIAWRLHDSQFWSVPQRRKRIALLADFNGLTAGDIMFDPQYRRKTEGRVQGEVERHIGTESGSKISSVSQGMSGDPESSGEAQKGVAGNSEESAGEPIPLHDKATRFRGGGKGRHDDGGGNGLGIGEPGQNMWALSTAERHSVMQKE